MVNPIIFDDLSDGSAELSFPKPSKRMRQSSPDTGPSHCLSSRHCTDVNEGESHSAKVGLN